MRLQASAALTGVESAAGVGVGSGVGVSVGAAAGVGVGSGVGVLVGVAVGVGVLVGATVGMGVGSGVGSGSSPQAVKTTATARTVISAIQRTPNKGYVHFSFVLGFAGA